MRKAVAVLLVLAFLPAATTPPSPVLVRDDLEVTIDEATGTVTVRYLTVYVEGKLAIWGPNFYYDTTYWGQVGNASCESLGGAGVRCYAESPDGTFAWELKPITGSDFILLEYTVTAESNWTYSAIAWVLDLPVDSFSGASVYAITLPYGTAERVTLRPEHVPGQADLRSSGSGAGWVVPISLNVGIAATFFTDAATRVNIAATDEREWGGGAYRLRFYYPGEWGSPKQLKPGDSVKFFIYMLAYANGEEEAAQRQVFSISYLRDTGLTCSELLDLILGGKIEQYLEQKKRERQMMLVVYALAAVGIVVGAAVATFKRRRASRRSPEL